MRNKSTVIESEKVLKEIYSRLNDSNRKICLLDSYDNSKIVIDDDVVDILKGYYKGKIELINFKMR